MKNIYIRLFNANNPNLKVEDVITKISAAKSDVGIINIRFYTKEKYYHINTNGGLSSNDRSGECITIEPMIYVNGEDLHEKDFDTYLTHPDYFMLELFLDHKDMGEKYFICKTTPLKYEYHIAYIPDSLIFEESLHEVTFKDFYE